MQQEQSNPQDRPTKPYTVHSKQLDWSEYEAGEPGEDAVSVIAHGYELTVGRVLDDEQKPTKEWSWMVRMTSEISETPEVVELGTAKSEGGAKILAKEALNRERRSAYKAARKAYDARVKAAQAKAAKKALAATAKKAPATPASTGKAKVTAS